MLLLEEALERLAALQPGAGDAAEHAAAGLVQVVREAPALNPLRLERADLVVQNARLLYRLLQERRWLEAAVHHLSSGVVILDRRGSVVGFNLAMERLSGWTPEDAVGSPGAETFCFLQPSNEQVLHLTEPPGSAAHGALRVQEALLVARDGARLWVEVGCASLHDDVGNPLGSIITVRDIRARKERERLESIFLSGVSHELQTPVAIIKGFAGLLADEELVLPPAQQRQHARIIFHEAERLERLVRDLLDVTRMRSGGVTLACEPVDLEALVGRVLRKLEPQVREGRCTLQWRPQRLGLVWADPARVEQVLHNLIDNALKHGRSDGAPIALEVATRPRGEHVEVCVSDDGKGVAGPDQERIFEAFGRGGHGGGAPGAGLGLFVCKTIVEAHRGSLRLVSPAPRSTPPPGAAQAEEPVAPRGAAFCFTLPLYLKDEKSTSSAGRRSHP